MSLEEPREPIVRIRKKKVKRKSKDNGTVRLPVRTSISTLYSSITPPVNIERNSRECCRHLFANCLKIPGCKLVCLRCILPQCCTGNDSDEGEIEAQDEGYHSQNRRSSSEISPAKEKATCGVEPREVKMTEIKCNSTIITHKSRYTVNDYRKEPFKKTLDSPSSESTKEDNINCGITDKEIGYVLLTEWENIPNNTLCGTIKSKTGQKTGSKIAVDSVSEVSKSVILNELDKKGDILQDSAAEYTGVMVDKPVLSPDFIDLGENSNDSKCKNYVKEDVLKICSDKHDGSRATFDKQIKQDCGKKTKTRTDTGFDEIDPQNEVKTESIKHSIKHSIKKKSCDEGNVDTTNSDKSDEYLNLNLSESNETNAQCNNENIIKELVVSLDIESCDGYSKPVVKIQSENNNIDSEKGVQRSKDCVNEFPNVDTTETVLSKNVFATRTTDTNDKVEFSKYIHKSEGVTDVMSLENSKTQKINKNQVICVDDHDKLLVKTESEPISDSKIESLSHHKTKKEDDEGTQ